MSQLNITQRNIVDTILSKFRKIKLELFAKKVFITVKTNKSTKTTSDMPDRPSNIYQYIRLVDKSEDTFTVIANTRIAKIDAITKEITQIRSRHSYAQEYKLGEQPVYMNKWNDRNELELTKEEFLELNELFKRDKQAFLHYIE